MYERADLDSMRRRLQRLVWQRRVESLIIREPLTPEEQERMVERVRELGLDELARRLSRGESE